MEIRYRGRLRGLSSRFARGPSYRLRRFGRVGRIGAMADDELPDNIDLRFLAKQNARILRELGEMREQTQNIPQMRADISEIQIAVAAISTDLKAVKADVAGIAAVQKNQGERLNAIDGRLGLLEKHIGIIDI